MKKLIPALIIGMGLSAGAFAAPDGTITFNGALTATTCNITGNSQGKNFTVTLPTVSTSLLTAAALTTGVTPFSIALTGCSPASGNVHTFFNTGTSTMADGNLKNMTGTAQNVEVQVMNGDLSVIKLNMDDASQNSLSTAIATDGTATLNYAAQYYATAATTAGTVATTVTYNMSYN